MIKNAVKNRFY